jgi:aryl-alcohol dehydrogenase-like predicted oxidoreductase
MEFRMLGSSGLSVPVVGMGTWKTFDVDEDRGPLVAVALSADMKLFDSSPMYGRAERVLSAALAGRRGEALVATKVWTSSDSEAAAQIERALGWYGGHVDLYQVHNLVAWQARLRTLEALRDAGQVTAVGITHYDHGAFDDVMQIMRSGRVSSVQVTYNAADRVVERRLLPLAEELGIGVVVMRPVGVGALARLRVSVSELAPLRDFGVRTWPQALLKWLVSDPRVTCVIPATSRIDHALENAEAGAPPWFGREEREYVAKLAASAA